MAFQNKNLSVITYVNGFTLWHCVSIENTFTEIITDGYFESVKTLWNTGDMVIINATDKSGMAFCTQTNPILKLTTETK